MRPQGTHSLATHAMPLPDCAAKMSNSDGSPQRDDGLQRRTRSRSPISPGCKGETPTEQEERRPAEAAVRPSSQPGSPSGPHATLRPGPSQSRRRPRPRPCRPASVRRPAHVAEPPAGSRHSCPDQPGRGPRRPASTRGQGCVAEPPVGGGRGRTSQPRRGPCHPTSTRGRGPRYPLHYAETDARSRCGQEGEQRGRQVPRPHAAQAHPPEPPNALTARGTPGARICLRRGAATGRKGRPWPAPEARAGGYHHDAAGARISGPGQTWRGRGGPRGWPWRAAGDCSDGGGGHGRKGDGR